MIVMIALACGDGGLAPALKNTRGTFEKRQLPLMDHRRMNAIFRGQPRRRPPPLLGFQRHSSLEGRIMFLRFDMF